MIKLDNLTKIFSLTGREVVAADHVKIDVREGEICVLLGPSGCGKTTALTMINRLVAPTSGKIYINGRDTDAYRVTELRRSIGFVPAVFGLFVAALLPIIRNTNDRLLAVSAHLQTAKRSRRFWKSATRFLSDDRVKHPTGARS